MVKSGQKQFITAITCTGLLLMGTSLSAQHAGHGGYGQREDTTGWAALTESRPLDDAVLEQAPGELYLQFPSHVRLVKLTLRSENRDWVDINFRYNPRPDAEFNWELPPLQHAVYYTADWAILSMEDQLIRGSFSFAFGPGAEPPSLIRAAEELNLLPPGAEPGTRYVAPPPTQIILDEEPRQFDPPFTINLDDDQ